MPYAHEQGGGGGGGGHSPALAAQERSRSAHRALMRTKAAEPCKPESGSYNACHCQQLMTQNSKLQLGKVGLVEEWKEGRGLGHVPVD